MIHFTRFFRVHSGIVPTFLDCTVGSSKKRELRLRKQQKDMPKYHLYLRQQLHITYLDFQLDKYQTILLFD
jgi:hypothetical protein